MSQQITLAVPLAWSKRLKRLNKRIGDLPQSSDNISSEKGL
jgi:hypothetical protein